MNIFANLMLNVRQADIKSVLLKLCSATHYCLQTFRYVIYQMNAFYCVADQKIILRTTAWNANDIFKRGFRCNKQKVIGFMWRCEFSYTKKIFRGYLNLKNSARKRKFIDFQTINSLVFCKIPPISFLPSVSHHSSFQDQ